MKIVVAIVVVVLAFGAWWFFSGQKTGQSEVALNTEETPIEALPEAGNAAAPLVDSIREAMRLGGQMRCTYTGGTGMGATTTVLVAGKQFYVQSQVGDQASSALFDGETQYVWTAGAKEGMKMSQACLENLSSTVPDEDTKPSNPNSAPTDYRQMLDAAQNVQCEPIETQPLETLLPKDVVFTDQCAMMDQAKKMMEQYKDQIPDRMPSGAVQY